MSRKVAVRLIVLVGVQLLWSVTASAQTAPVQPSGCFLYLTANDLGIDLGVPPPPGAGLISQNNVIGLEGLSVYQVTDPTCPPPAASTEVDCCPGCSGCGNSGGAPISLVDGNTYIVQADVKIPGLAGGLNFTRSWNSLWPPTQTAFQVGLFGPHWRSTYEERIFVGSDGYVKYARGDGSFWSFACPSWSGCGLVAPGNVKASLTVNNNYTLWTITFQNGEQRVFSYASGSLTSIVDRNGNTTQLTYDAIGRLVTVTDPGGRHLYFSYANNTSYLVSGVTSDVGISLSYAYDSQGRLSQVTEPDLTTLSFAYDSNSNIATVTDSAGKILESHTYDSLGRGLTSSRANGVEAITVSYGSN